MLSRFRFLLLENKSTRQTIAKNVFWLSVSQIGSRLIRAVIIIYAARVLGAAEYGIFSYVLGFAAFFTVFADIGVNSLLTRDVANHPGDKTRYFAASFWLKIGLNLLTVFLVVFVAPYFTNIKEAIVLIPLVAILTVSDNIRDFTLAYFRGLQKMEREAFVVTMMNIVIMASGFAILYFSQTARALLYAYMASVVFAALLSIFLAWEQFGTVFRYFDKSRIWQTLKTCWPIAFSGVIGVFMLNIDVVMLGWWRAPEEIGLYSAAQRIIQLLYALPALLASGTFPVVARLINEGEKEKSRLIKESSMAMVLLVALPVVVGGIILGQPIMKFVFGEEYAAGAPAFKILLTTIPLVFAGTLLYNFVLAHNVQKQTVKYVAAGSLGNVVFNSLFIPLYGIAGAASATLIAQVLNIGLTWLKLKKIENFFTLRHLNKIFVSAIIMGLTSYFLNKVGFNVVLNIVLSGALYFVLLFLLKEPILKEILSLFKILKNK